jgi:hypothetical protein
MNPEISPTYPTPVEKKKHTALKTLGATLLSILILGLAGYATYAWLQNNELRNDISNKEMNIKTLTAQVDDLKSKDPTAGDTSISTLLPNGKTATYPDTDGNRNMLFWSAGSDNATANFILLSHKGIQQFLSGVNSDTIVGLCGTDANLKALKYNISVGIFNTSEKILGQPQNNNCLDVLASMENSDSTLRAKAQAVVSQVKSDTDDFVKSVSIK